MDLTVRFASIDEKNALEALQWRASLCNESDREALLAHPDAIELPVEQIQNNFVIVALHEGVIMGFGAILMRDDGDAELDAMFVEPTFWRQGIGRKLVDMCIELASNHHSKILHVLGNPHAEAFYLSCGFEATGSEKTRFGVAITMQRELK